MKEQKELAVVVELQKELKRLDDMASHVKSLLKKYSNDGRSDGGYGSDDGYANFMTALGNTIEKGGYNVDCIADVEIVLSEPFNVCPSEYECNENGKTIQYIKSFINERIEKDGSDECKVLEVIKTSLYPYFGE